MLTERCNRRRSVDDRLIQTSCVCISTTVTKNYCTYYTAERWVPGRQQKIFDCQKVNGAMASSSFSSVYWGCGSKKVHILGELALILAIADIDVHSFPSHSVQFRNPGLLRWCPHQVFVSATALKRERLPLADLELPSLRNSERTLPSGIKCSACAEVIFPGKALLFHSSSLRALAVREIPQSLDVFVGSQIAGYRNDRNTVDLTLFWLSRTSKNVDIIEARQLQRHTAYGKRTAIRARINGRGKLGAGSIWTQFFPRMCHQGE
ncbi:unnamed protein product [Cylicocyclus nassatus]|uniref:Uncharacterized protein n=1 Tax=Cylicocyclus nassatus TaxID=53992 RepID=A0AA36MEM0_CYLNA|nr:unnamed protein product [Cylicocyclus nassatus]